MKVFFAGDNSANLNWGRGASIALRELLSREFEITGTVPGELFDLALAEAGFVGTLTPPRFYGAFRQAWRRQSRWPFSWYIKLERLFGAKDFIAENPITSVDRLLEYRHKYWALARIDQQVRESDAIVIDGDGDIIFSNPPRRQTLFILAMIELGIRLNKPVFLVNSMLSDCPTSGRNEKTLGTARELFGKCKAMSLRDMESLLYAQTHMPEAKSCLIPDSLFAWYPRYATKFSAPPHDGDFLLPHPEPLEYWGKLDFSKPYICIGGGAGASADPARAELSYGKLVDGVAKLGLPIHLTENDSPDAFLHRVARTKGLGVIPVGTPILAGGAVLAHARLFISGRYHPSIFASLGGTPCIFLGSHAHKMKSISNVLEYERNLQFDAFPSDTQIEQIVTLSAEYLEQGETLRTRVQAVARVRYEEVMRLPAFLKKAMLN
jgi:Polysaccharide pyruvyl transferase